MRTLKKIISTAVFASILLVPGSDYRNDLKYGDSHHMERVSIRKHGIINYILHKDFLGENYIDSERF